MDYSTLLRLTRAEVIARAQGEKSIPLTVRLGIVAALTFLTDADYARYIDWFDRAMRALGSTPEGREVLSEVGLATPIADR